MISLDDLQFNNKEFWTSFIMVSFPTSLDKDTDMSLSELVEENETINADDWWSEFTKYYDGVFEENDGYIDEPETLIYNLTDTQTLKIEFHPGDIVYYINDRQIACTGPEYNIQIFPFRDLLSYMKLRKDNRIFLLLLPLTVISKQDAKYATKIIAKALSDIFNKRLCNLFAKCIVYGLIEE